MERNRLYNHPLLGEPGPHNFLEPPFRQAAFPGKRFRISQSTPRQVPRTGHLTGAVHD